MAFTFEANRYRPEHGPVPVFVLADPERMYRVLSLQQHATSIDGQPQGKHGFASPFRQVSNRAYQRTGLPQVRPLSPRQRLFGPMPRLDR